MQFNVLMSPALAKNKQLLNKIKKQPGINLELITNLSSALQPQPEPSFYILDEHDFQKLFRQHKMGLNTEDKAHLFIVFYQSAEKLANLIIEHAYNCEFYDYALLKRLPEIIRTKQKYAEKLRQNLEQDRFKMIVQNMPIMVDALDENNNFVFWNRECERITGYSAQEIVNNPQALELLYPDEPYRNQIMAQYAKQGNHFRDWMLTLTTKTGEKRVISWSNLADLYQVPGWHSWAVGIDVTAQQQIQQKLQNTEFIFNTLVDISKIINQRKTEEKIIEQIMFRIREFLPFDSSVLLLYDYQQQVAELISSIINNKSFFKSAKPIPLKNLLNLDLVKKGEVVYIPDLRIYEGKLSIIRSILKFGHRSGFIVPMMLDDNIVGSMSFAFKESYILDKTKETALLYIGQKLAKTLKNLKLIQELNERIILLENDRLEYFNDLKKNEARLRAQFENLPLPTTVWRKQGDDFILVDYNDMAMASTYGLINEFFGKSSKEISFFSPHLTELLNECYVNEITLETQLKFSLPESGSSYYSLKMAYVAPDTVLMHFEDITEQKSHELQLKKKNEILLHQMKVIELLKEERTIFKENLFPVIQGVCNILWEKRELVENTEFANTLIKSHEKVLAYLDFFTHYFSIESDRFIKEKVNLSRMIAKVSQNLTEPLEKAEAQVLTFFEEPELETDGALLEQILEILFRFSLSRRHPDRKHLLRVVSTREGERLKLTVKDNGLGLTVNELTELLETDESKLDLSNWLHGQFLILKKLSRIVGSQFQFNAVPEEGCQYALIFE